MVDESIADARKNAVQDILLEFEEYVSKATVGVFTLYVDDIRHQLIQNFSLTPTEANQLIGQEIIGIGNLFKINPKKYDPLFVANHLNNERLGRNT